MTATATAIKRPKRKPWPAVAGIVMIVQLLVINGVHWLRNQSKFVKEDRPRVVPRDIGRIATLNNYDPVRTTFHMYYALRELDGATLVIPQIMWAHEFHFERVSRLKIEIQPESPPITNAFLDKLRHEGRVTKVLHIDVSSWLDVVIVKGTSRYVLGRSVDGTVWVILPEELLKQDRPAS